MQNFGTLSWPRRAESTLFCNFWTIKKNWLYHLADWSAWHANFISKILESYRDKEGRNYPFQELLNYTKNLAPSIGRLISLASQYHMQNFGTPLWAGGSESTLFCNFCTIKKSWLHHLADWLFWPADFIYKILEPHLDQGGQNLPFSATSELWRKVGSITCQIDLLGQLISYAKFWDPIMTKGGRINPFL